MRGEDGKLQIESCKLKAGQGGAFFTFVVRELLMTPEELSDRLLDFAARIGKLADALPDTRMGRHIAGQIIRSGTSAAQNYEEGCAAESRREFAHKLQICLKELRETRLWLRLILRASLLSEKRLTKLLEEADSLCKIIGKTVVTAKRQPPKKSD